MMVKAEIEDLQMFHLAEDDSDEICEILSLERRLEELRVAAGQIPILSKEFRDECKSASESIKELSKDTHAARKHAIRSKSR